MIFSLSTIIKIALIDISHTNRWLLFLIIHLLMFSSKDFIETQEGLLFAIVADGMEKDMVRCFLRYQRNATGWHKLNSQQAQDLLKDLYPDYLFYSKQLACQLHAVAVNRIYKHYTPKQRLKQLLTEVTLDPVINDSQQLCLQLTKDHPEWLNSLGITGSILPAVHNQNSDIDLVCYDRTVFQQLRLNLQNLLNTNICQALSQQDWLEAYHRRACTLSLEDYIWHEQRKFNKAMFNGRKFDLSLVNSIERYKESYPEKRGFICIQAVITNADAGFDYPAEFSLDHATISTVQVFTATYIGQALVGEHVEVAGQLEVDHDGTQRIIVGSNREAIGEYIKVLDDK